MHEKATIRDVDHRLVVLVLIVDEKVRLLISLTTTLGLTSR